MARTCEQSRDWKAGGFLSPGEGIIELTEQTAQGRGLWELSECLRKKPAYQPHPYVSQAPSRPVIIESSPLTRSHWSK